MTENLYAIYTGTQDQPTIYYIGTTKRTVAERFAEHQKSASNPRTTKELYETMRQVGIEKFKVLDLGQTTDDLFESSLVKAAILEGHPLKNANRGNSKVSKEKDFSWRDLNRSAERKLNELEFTKTTAERRQRLHSPTQVLKKSEIVAHRITGELPTADTLDGLDWVPAPIELMPFRRGAPKNQENMQCWSLKYGDLLFIIAIQKSRFCTYLKNTTNCTATSTNTQWSPCRPGYTRVEALDRLLNDLPKCLWWPVSSFHD